MHNLWRVFNVTVSFLHGLICCLSFAAYPLFFLGRCITLLVKLCMAITIDTKLHNHGNGVFIVIVSVCSYRLLSDVPASCSSFLGERTLADG